MFRGVTIQANYAINGPKGLGPLEKWKKRRSEAMPKFFIVMCICGIFATGKCIAGHSLGA